ncbi:BamA/TamA family outer membrane protein [Microcoleus sp. N3A4]|uniref:BamA/TamA family outer membrane protein n=1 Tax=Microcoleus sp. N3A4 TaxID=3055379 RepID=UPI002FD5F4B3
MRIPIIAFLTLAAVAGGELAARAIDPSAAPTEAEFREGTAEIDRRDACPTRAQREEDEVSLTSGTILKNGQDARPTRDELFCGTGILPVHKGQDARSTTDELFCGTGILPVHKGQDARPTRDELFCGTGKMPVHKKLIENGATSQVSPTLQDLPASDELAVAVEVPAAQLSPRESPSYRFRLHQNNKIESTVNTQPFSFSTPPSTVNSQQSTVNNHLTVQPELISLKSSHQKDFTSLLKTPATIAANAEIPEPVNSNARQLGGTLQITQAGNAEGLYVAEVKIRFVNSRGEAVDKKGNPVEGRISEDFIRGELKLKAGDNYSPSVVRSDLQQLQQLGLFDKVTVSTEEVGTDVNVIYNVQERSARSFSVSASLSDDVGVAVPLSYTDRTFGTTPQRLAVELEPSLRGIQYDVQFVSPYVAAEDRLGYSVRAFGDRRISEIFNKDIDLPNGDRVREIRMGGNLRFTRPLGDWQSTLGLNYTNISTRDRNLNIARRDELGNPLTFSGSGVDELYTVSFGAMLDRRDNPFNPTSGSILSLSTEQSIPLGRGNIVSNRLLANYIQYVPLTLLGISESEALPEMLAFNLQGGTVIGDLPPTEAFRLGGRNSVRGYDSGDIGSGRSYFLASGEYRFPVGQDVGGVIFVDFASDLGTGDSVLGKPAVVRDKPGTGAGVGVGVRVRSSFGLIRLDMGVSDSGEIKFVLGTKQRF